MTQSTAFSAQDTRRELHQAWRSFRLANPGVPQHEAACSLGTTEAAIVAAACGENATRLEGPWPELLQSLRYLGPVLAITRNEHAVLESVGMFSNVQIMGDMGAVLDDGIDLWVHLDQWHVGFAVREISPPAPRYSLQFFGTDGAAVHKVYLTEDSNHAAFESIEGSYASADQSPEQELPRGTASPRPLPPTPEAAQKPGGREKPQLRKAIGGHPLLQRLGVGGHPGTNEEALKATRRVHAAAYQELLLMAEGRRVKVTAMVGNSGAVQLRSGPVANLHRANPWFSAMDRGFSLHVRGQGVAAAWVVRNPVLDGG